MKSIGLFVVAMAIIALFFGYFFPPSRGTAFCEKYKERLVTVSVQYIGHLELRVILDTESNLQYLILNKNNSRGGVAVIPLIPSQEKQLQQLFGEDELKVDPGLSDEK